MLEERRSGALRARLSGSRLVLAGGLALATAVAGACGDAATSAGDPAALNAGQGAKPIARTKCSEFPANNYWHADIRNLPVHERSSEWLSHMSTDVNLHPDFGPSFGHGPNYGIPITVVRKSHKRVRVRFYYAAESDQKLYPLGRDTRIEGGRNSDGDRHAIIVDKDRCKLYETFDTRKVGGKWRAGSGAIWSLKRNRLRPDGWTSADAAGLPILPGLARYDEVGRGVSTTRSGSPSGARVGPTSTPRATPRRATRPAAAADGPPPPSPCRLPRAAVPTPGERRSPHAQALRDDRRRQRGELVHLGRAAPAVVGRPAAHAPSRQGV